MSKLTTAQRNAQPARDFALPATRQYPIMDHEHARQALQELGHEPPRIQEAIRRAVYRRWPDLGPVTVVTHGPQPRPVRCLFRPMLRA